MTDRMQWLNDRLNEAYDGEWIETAEMLIECHMINGYKGTRTVRAVITWTEQRDEPVNLTSAIDKAIEVTTGGKS